MVDDWLFMGETRREAPHRLTGAPAAIPAPHKLRSQAGRCEEAHDSLVQCMPVDALYSRSPTGPEARSMRCMREAIYSKRDQLTPQARLRRVCGAGMAAGAPVELVADCKRK